MGGGGGGGRRGREVGGGEGGGGGGGGGVLQTLQSYLVVVLHRNGIKVWQILDVRGPIFKSTTSKDF